MGTIVIAAIIGYASERSGYTHNGYIPSIIICIGGAFLFFFISSMFRFGFGSPGVNAIVAIVWIIFSGWMMAIQYVDYPADNNGVSFDDLRKILGQHRGAALGFGLCTFGLTLVPIINLIILPAAVCGGVVFWVKKESTVSAVVAQN